MVDISGHVRRASRRSRTRSPPNFEQNGDVGASCAVVLRRRAGGRPVGRHARRRGHHPVGGGHDHQRVLHHEDDELPLAAGAGQPGPRRRRRAGRPLLARVRAERQGGRPRPPPAVAHRRPARPGTSASTSPTSTTGTRSPGCWPSRRRGGSRAGSPATTASRQGNLVGEVVRRRRRALGGPLLRGGDRQAARRRLPHRHRRPSATTGSPRSFPPRRSCSAPRRRTAARPDKTSIPYRASNPRLAAEESWTIPWRRAEIPAGGGHGNARSVALAQCRGVGRRVGPRRRPADPRATVERIFDVQAAGRDLVLGIGVTFGVGYGLNSPRAPDRAQPPGLLLGRLGRLARASTTSTPASPWPTS